MHKACIACSVLSDTGVNCFSPYRYEAFYWWLLGSALQQSADWQGCTQPASIALRYLQDLKLWTTENKTDPRPTLTLHKTSLLTGAQCYAASAGP